MSVQAPEAAPAPPPPQQRQGNVFTRRIGPLPMWAWVAIVGGIVLAWSFFKKKKGGGGLFGGGKSGKHTQEGAGGKPQAFLVPPYVGVWTYQAFPPENQPPEKGEPVRHHNRRMARRGGEDNENLEPDVQREPQPPRGARRPGVPQVRPGPEPTLLSQ